MSLIGASAQKVAAPKAPAVHKAAAASVAKVVAKSPAQKALEKLGLRRDIDLALHLPLRYEDETRIVMLRDARDGDRVQIEGQITHSEVTFRPRRQLRVTLDDGSDTCTLRFLNFYPSHQKTLSVGAVVRARGEIRGGFIHREIVHPSFKLAGGELPGALTPVYSTVAGLPQVYLRKAVRGGLARADLSETIPPIFIGKNMPCGIQALGEALYFLHHPTPDVALETLEDRTDPAWQRLKAEELLAQQLSQLQARRVRAAMRAPPLLGNGLQNSPCSLHDQLLERLPFRLTTAQQRVGSEIAADLQKNIPMHRLLQGDVGSGKTVVAALAAARCMDAGWQCALMAPTEILAEQHFRKLISWLEPLGIKTAWLTGSQKAKARREALALIASGEALLVVGTHAVIQDKVIFKNLALTIIDEQHRFGVAQRLALRSKMTDGGQEPHLLMMTATPIPRTLAMSYYADLDVSTIDELPPGRTPIVTKVVNDTRRDRDLIGVALKEFDLQFFFKLFDSHAERRLRHMTRLGTFAEVLFTRDGDEVFEFGERHAVIVCFLVFCSQMLGFVAASFFTGLNSRRGLRPFQSPFKPSKTQPCPRAIAQYAALPTPHTGPASAGPPPAPRPASRHQSPDQQTAATARRTAGPPKTRPAPESPGRAGQSQNRHWFQPSP